MQAVFAPGSYLAHNYTILHTGGLGGTTFTFGLILAVALLGIGLGGAAYAFWIGNARASCTSALNIASRWVCSCRPFRRMPPRSD